MKQIPITQEMLEYFDTFSYGHIMSGAVRNNEGGTLLQSGNNYALIMTYEDETSCYFLTDDLDFVKEVIANLSGEVSFCGVTPQIRDYLQSSFEFIWHSDCSLYEWNGEKLTYETTGDLRKMDKAYAQDISNGTPYHADLGEIYDAIDNRPSSALYVDGKPVCWCVVHSDGSLGMLYTLPEHRHKGYALQVMTDITKKVISSGNVPFCYIIKGNVASENLAPKYNLRYVGDAYYVGVKI